MDKEYRKEYIKTCLITYCIISLITVSAFAVYNKYKSGYVYENNTWNFVSYDAVAERSVKPIKVDKREFKKLKFHNFARDREGVYYKAYKIEDSDPDTFQVISKNGMRHYAKDIKNVYVYPESGSSVYKVIGADPASFEVLEFPYAKDKNDAYCGCLPLYVDDVTTFKVIEGSDSSHEMSIDGFLGNAFNPEYSNSMYNREKYGFVDDCVMYSDKGRAKTDKLVYKGYRLVGDNR